MSRAQTFNPGSTLWADFLTKRRDDPGNIAAAMQAWGRAEQASTDYGDKVGRFIAGAPNSRLELWMSLTGFNRSAVRGSESDRKRWDAGFYMFGVKFDPRSYSASRRGVEDAYRLAAAIDGEGRECWVDFAKLCW